MWTNKKFYSKTLQPPDIARSLPSQVYKNSVCFQVEQEFIFGRSWIPVGFTNDFENIIDGFKSYNAPNGESVIITKSSQNIYKAFSNVCIHRGNKLIDIEDCVTEGRRMVCKYHCFAYNLDGDLTNTPRYENCNIKEDGLFELEIGILNNIIFVRFSNMKQTLEEYYGDVVHRYINYPLEECKIVNENSYNVKANWKILVENFCEYLHLTNIHKDLVKVSTLDNHITTQGTGNYVSFMTCPITDLESSPINSSIMTPMRHYIENDIAHFIFLFPNCFMFLLPNHVYYVIIEPISPTESKEKSILMIHNNSIEDTDWVNSLTTFYDKVNCEDISICESVQSGLKNKKYKSGIFVLPYEIGTYDFQQLYIKHMTTPNGVSKL
jgi:choline monooxygenase